VTNDLRLRPQLDQLLDHLRQGDIVIVTKYDRLARSLRDLLDIVEIIKERGGGFRSLAEDIDTTTPAGRLIFHVFASIAQFERERISERTKEGLKAAKKRGRVEVALQPFRQHSGTRSAGCVTRRVVSCQRSRRSFELALRLCGEHSRRSAFIKQSLSGDKRA